MTRADPEFILHSTIVSYLDQLAPKNVIYWHTPNSGKRSKASAGRFKAMGLKAGVPDLAFVLSDGRAAFMELKAGSRLSPAQVEFAEKCDRIGVEIATAYNLDQALEILVAWKCLPKTVLA